VRWVRISEGLRAAPKAEQKRQARNRLKGYPECDWVCPSPKELLWRERNFSRSFEVLRGKGDEKGKHFKKIEVRPLTLHCTRHSFITWALEAGTPTATVGGWVGCSVRVIEGTYAHVIPQVGGVDFLDRPQASTNHPQDAKRESEASA